MLPFTAAPADYYEVLRPATDQDLEGVGPEAAAILEGLSPGGYVSVADLGGRPGAGAAVSRGRASGLLRNTGRTGRIIRFRTVRSWLSQLGQAKTARVANEGGTRHAYATALGAFNRWLAGRELDTGRAGDPHTRTFADIEELLAFCGGTDRGDRTAGKILRRYLAHSAASGMSVSTALVRCAAVKSYFAAHDVHLDAKVERNRHRPGGDSGAAAKMSLADLYKMMTAGGMNAMCRAIVMVKFQAGLDSSTLADRFNFDAYPQIVRRFGTEDYEAWDLARCPVPVRLVRVKTNTAYTTFLDRDAVACLRDYLRQKEFRGDRQERDRPLFTARGGAPIKPIWISHMFSRAAVRAGIQERISPGALRVTSHEARDLLKSTLMVCGCAAYAADHILGHAPRDSYEKQAVLYPEAVRREYAKASGALNLMTGVERYLGTVAAEIPPGASPGEAAGSGEAPVRDPRLDEILAQLRGVRADLRRTAGAVAGMARVLAPDGDTPGEVPGMIPEDMPGSGASGGAPGPDARAAASANRRKF